MVIFNELMARIAGRFGRIEPRDDGGIMACDDQFRLLQGVERVTVDLSVVEDFCTTFTTHNDIGTVASLIGAVPLAVDYRSPEALTSSTATIIRWGDGTLINQPSYGDECARQEVEHGDGRFDRRSGHQADGVTPAELRRVREGRRALWDAPLHIVQDDLTAGQVQLDRVGGHEPELQVGLDHYQVRNWTA